MVSASHASRWLDDSDLDDADYANVEFHAPAARRNSHGASKSPSSRQRYDTQCRHTRRRVAAPVGKAPRRRLRRGVGMPI